MKFPHASKTLSDEQQDCFGNGQLFPAACLTNRFNFFLNRSTAVRLTPNNGIVLSGIIVEIVDINADTQPVDEVRKDKCRMSFVDQPLTFSALQAGTFMTRTFQLSDPSGAQQCSGLVVAEISVNCIGEGKGFCRVGNPCVADADCETGSCSSCSGGTCTGVGDLPVGVWKRITGVRSRIAEPARAGRLHPEPCARRRPAGLQLRALRRRQHL